MPKFRTPALAGVVALAIAGAALAANRDMHILKVGLPDGSVARIEYAGDVAPKVTVAPASGAAPTALLDAFDTAPFAAFDRIAASMDRDMDTMVHEIGALQPLLTPDAGKLDLAALSKLPPGTVSYRLVSTGNGNEMCSRSVEVTSYGPDQKPKVVSSSSGDCAPTNRVPTPTRLDSPTGPAVPATTRAGETDMAERSRAANTI
ncbi:hypothetical protein HZF05_10270 [Sphingomonas sp. CGMCC 1.13654]|uniref:Uncharacterized protein n=1 Tax=Sphingomonas chungangi TaxID=2683589 RepID=A0A838L724_9SPHN|nr:hypothetical protein [Sphingomonas chungangi]MBA2934482.1 hypothetical protein [Sphingomonas chungangi]MVW57521.1 hypothetical protein [Sphingomonas chungangi]